MWGLAHAGIEQFKQGFGGREANYIGAFDLVTLPLLRDVVVTGRRLWVPVGASGLCRPAPRRGPRQRAAFPRTDRAARLVSTWTRPLGGLIGQLEARGMLRSVLSPGGTPPAAMPVSSVVLDSRAVQPGALFAALPGPARGRHEFAAQGRGGRRGGDPGRARRARPDDPAGAGDGGPPRARAGGGVAVRLPQPQARRRRHHRHGRQDHDLLPGARDARGRRLPDRHGRHDRRRGRRAASLGNAARATTPEAPELQAHLAGMVDGRRSLRGGRVDLPRPGPGPRLARSPTTSAC